MSKKDAERILIQFFLRERNIVGDYWSHDMAKEAVETLLGRELKEPQCPTP